MEEIIQKLLESDLLTEDTAAQISKAVEQLQEDAEAKIRVELTEEFVQEKERLVEAIDTKVEERLQAEIQELREGIESFRDLEVEFAERETQLKEHYAATLKSDLTRLVETLDAFVESRLDAEFEELKESIEEVQKNRLGTEVFEGLREMFSKYIDEDVLKLQDTLAENQAELEKIESRLKESQIALSESTRKEKLNSVLKDLTGKQRDIMEAVLKAVPTEKLDEGYDRYIGKVLAEAPTTIDNETSEKDSKVLAETASGEAKEETVTITGNEPKETTLEEGQSGVDKPKGGSSDLDRLRALSGITG